MCGCGIKKTFSKNPNNIKTNSKSTTVELERNNCLSKYRDLQDLNLKVLEMIRSKFNNENNILSKTNKQIRLWIKNLSKECPPEEELQAISKYIEDEYTKYKA
jgi:hypothetical protein